MENNTINKTIPVTEALNVSIFFSLRKPSNCWRMSAPLKIKIATPKMKCRITTNMLIPPAVGLRSEINISKSFDSLNNSLNTLSGLIESVFKKYRNKDKIHKKMNMFAKLLNNNSIEFIYSLTPLPSNKKMEKMLTQAMQRKDLL